MCQGAPLARTELGSTFRALRGLSEFRLAKDDAALEYMKAHSFMGLVRLDLNMQAAASG
jgi:hypothetical protein